MRSFLGWAILVALLLAIGFVLAPIVVRPLIADAVRAVSPFGGEPLDVSVDVSTTGLLHGTIDSVHVIGASLASERLTIGHLDLTVSNVGIGDHSFSAVTGDLDDVALQRADAGDAHARRVTLTGPSDAVDATASIDKDSALAMVRAALASAGLPAGDLALTSTGVRLTVLGQSTEVALRVVDGSVAIAGSIAGAGSIVVFGPEPGDPWQITAVSVSPDGLDLRASLDLNSALSGR
jgi:hypothetical protein